MRTARFDYRLLTTPLRGKFSHKDKVPKFLELMRWPHGIGCPHCNSREVMRFRVAKRKLESRYLHFCRACRRQFTVTTGTALHRTHVPLEKWLAAITLIKATSRELTATSLVRNLGVTHKTAQLMCRRLRRGMKGSFLRNLFLALRAHKKPERIYRNLFPDLYEA